MGFTAGDIAAPWLTTNQRNPLLGQCTDLNILSWVLSIINDTRTRLHNPPNPARPDYPGPSTYNFSQPLLDLKETGTFPNWNHTNH